MSAPVASTSSLDSLSTYASSSKSRLISLYSDVSRQKQSNPSTYTTHVQWWHETLQCLVEQGLQSRSVENDVLVLHANPNLVERLRYLDVGKPLGLGSIIVSMTLYQHTYFIN